MKAIAFKHDPASTEETRLMADYVNGNERAFQELFETLGPRVRRFFLRKFGDEAIADDMRQITFLKMHRARGHYRLGEPVRPWLFTIAARVRIDELRRRRRLESRSADDLDRANADAAVAQTRESHVVERADIAAKVRDAVATLPDSQRVVVQLHRYQEMTFREIADHLGVTEAAAKLRAFRAYGTLRTQLTPILHEAA